MIDFSCGTVMSTHPDLTFQGYIRYLPDWIWKFHILGMGEEEVLGSDITARYSLAKVGYHMIFCGYSTVDAGVPKVINIWVSSSPDLDDSKQKQVIGKMQLTIWGNYFGSISDSNICFINFPQYVTHTNYRIKLSTSIFSVVNSETLVLAGSLK